MPPERGRSPDAHPAEDADAAPERVLWERVHAHGDERARQSLITRYLPYARVVAATYYARRTHDEIEFAEYLQFASMGMIESISRFDPTLGVQFKTFAARRMHGAILNGLERLTEKNQQIAVRTRLRKESLQSLKEAPRGAGGNRKQEDLFVYLAEVGVGVALSILLEGTGMMDAGAEETGASMSPEIRYFRVDEMRQLRRVLTDLVGRLTEQERTVIRYHYLQEVPFDEIAGMLGLTKGRISQIHRKALMRLRDWLRAGNQFDLSA